MGTDESRFNVILASRNFKQLNATYMEYVKVSALKLEAPSQNRPCSTAIDQLIWTDLEGYTLSVKKSRPKVTKFLASD